MKKIFTCVSGLTLAMGVSTSALANDYFSLRAGSSSIVHSGQHFSYANSHDSADNFKYNAGSKTDTVFSGGAAVGHDFYQDTGTPFRIEAEVYGRASGKTNYSPINIADSNGALRGDIHNKVQLTTLMANAYYDFRNDSSFTPWISAGIGLARIKQSSTGVISTQVNSVSDTAHHTEHNLAWGVGTGVSYAVTPNVSIDLSYRYLDAGKTSASYKMHGETYKSKIDVVSHDVMLGATFSFQ